MRIFRAFSPENSFFKVEFIFTIGTRVQLFVISYLGGNITITKKLMEFHSTWRGTKVSSLCNLELNRK